MPWLTGTAFIHSIMVQERRGMLKVWNVSLIVATFALSLLGTFLVRSGILQSIHAFGESIIQVLEFERPNQPTAEAMALGRALGHSADLATAGILLADDSASARYAGAVALREMVAQGVEGAAEAAKEAARNERNSLVASTLLGANR